MKKRSDQDNAESPARKFWRAQFSEQRTGKQKIFDALFGIVLPILCFRFDPIVFSEINLLDELTNGIARFRPFVYFFSLTAILALSLCLILGNRASVASGLLTGILLAGGAVSLIIGFWILPLTLMGLMLVVGIFGFIPFLTSFVYFRNGIRALNQAGIAASVPRLVSSALFGAFLVVGIACFAQLTIEREVQQLLSDASHNDLAAAEIHTHRLHYVAWATDLRPMVDAFYSENDEARKGYLVRVYQDLTGKDIQTAFPNRND